MKRLLLSAGILIILSTAGYTSELKGFVSACDAATGTFEVCGVEVITREDWTIFEDRQKKPASPGDLMDGDYVEIEGRFIEPAKLEATRITMGKEVVTGPVTEVIEVTGTAEEAPAPGEPALKAPEAGPEQERKDDEATTEPVMEQAAPTPTKPPTERKDKLKGALQNADVKTRILIVKGTVVKLDAGVKVVGKNGKAVSLQKLRRGDRVVCEGTRLSKKEFQAGSVQVLK